MRRVGFVLWWWWWWWAPRVASGACFNASANAAVLAQGAALQCAGVHGVKMPCLDAARSEAVPPRVFHLHLSKMNGRSVLDRATPVTGLPHCPWTAKSGSASTFRGFSGLRERLRRAAGTPASRCVTSYETYWDVAVDACVGDGGPPPLFLTVLRAPLSWAASKIRHKSNRHVEGCVRGGAFDGGAPSPDCGAIDFRRFGLLHLGPLAPSDGVAGCAAPPHHPIAEEAGRAHPPPRLGGWNATARIDVAYARLEASVFGVVEHMAASYCLWRFQFGTLDHFKRDCDCRRRERTRAKREADGLVAATKYQENATVESFLRIERAMADYARLYARAEDLFRRRAEAVEAATGARLLCDDSFDPGDGD